MIRTLFAAALLGAALALAGCGGSEEQGAAADTAQLSSAAAEAQGVTGSALPPDQARAERRARAAERRRALLAERARKAEIRRADLAARGVTELTWEEMLPEGEEERLAELYQAQMATLYNITEGSPQDIAIQIGTFNTVEALDGELIRLPGYTVPFTFGKDAEITDFLLVPYFGACLHAPPPPPNQTVYVTTKTPIKINDLAQAVWIEGRMRTQREDTELANAAYTIEMVDIEEYTE